MTKQRNLESSSRGASNIAGLVSLSVFFSPKMQTMRQTRPGLYWSLTCVITTNQNEPMFCPTNSCVIPVSLNICIPDTKYYAKMVADNSGFSPYLIRHFHVNVIFSQICTIMTQNPAHFSKSIRPYSSQVKSKSQ